MKNEKDLNKFKNGIVMIELIFAIVIIGVTLMSAPMLINQSINSSNIAMQQEAITATASHNGMILTKYWDEAGTVTQDGQSPILVTGTIVNEEMENNSPNPFAFIIDGSNIYRAGMKNIVGRISSIDGNPVASTKKENLKSDTNETSVEQYDDVDDFNDGKGYGVNEPSASDSTTVKNGDYLDQNISIATTVKYITDVPTTFATNTITPNLLNATEITTSSNIKLIETRLRTSSSESELAKNIVLYSFSTNIGSSVPQGRRVE
ncbi:MAG: hypothetical protein IE878_02660 [Epsilonproteobacteria bacterium]|nr:hypothetical protein [Campylobacterota bacterium]MBD3839274.1 hypothetical protein [Campylobacterota bacterium]